jgi:tetratricopeptide (TPR) repeat protein
MYKIFISIFLVFSLFSIKIDATEDSINRFTADYLKRINDYISDDDFENAIRELTILSTRYFLNEQSYERALINQLWGNVYAMQAQYDKAIDSYEASLRFRRIPLITNLQIRTNLAQCYFQVKNFKKVIEVLLEYKEQAEKRGQEFSPKNRVMIGIAYYYEENFELAYQYISSANEMSIKYEEDWLRYELALAVKLDKIDEAIETGQLLIYVNPEKKEYWQQVSGLYYTQKRDDESLAGLELAFDNNLLVESKEYVDLARYYLYKGLPQKAVKVIEYGFDKDFLELNNENYELLADSYFIARDRENGIKALQSSLSIKEDEDIAFKIARFGFEDENWVLALKYFNEAKKLGWNKSPGRLELLMGITQYELGNLNESINFFNIALDQDDTKSAAEGWISFVEDIIKNS